MLMAKSPVFKKMLSSKMLMDESINNELTITDCDDVTIKHFLHYLYTDELITSSDMQLIITILKMAHMYEVKGLLRECEIKLGSVLLNSNNCFDLLQLADMYSCTALRQYVVHYIREHRKDFNEHRLSKIFKDLSEEMKFELFLNNK